VNLEDNIVETVKWLSAGQLLTSIGYPTELVLATCKCGEPFMTSVCTPLLCKLSSSTRNWLHWVCSLPLALKTPAAPHKVTFVDEATFIRQNDKYTGIHMSGHLIILTYSWKYIFRAIFLVRFGVVLLEAKSQGCLYLNSAWRLGVTSISRKMSYQCC
jgi:hypothetical protein